MDFRGFDDLLGYSKKILPEGSNPFPKVQKSHATKITEAFKLRNYLSHYSAKAKNNLMHMYKTQYHLTQFREPGFFLFVDSGKRLWAYFDSFEGASTDMKKSY